MSDAFELMLNPFLACAILTLMHTYLGIHVLERQVVFVDLALAQIAALGAACGILFGWGFHSTESSFLSLGFTAAGAAVLAATRLKRPGVPQEALIGVVYAVSAAAAILVLSRAAEGGEELKGLLVGHLLLVDSREILKLVVLYSAAGVIHWIFRRQFFLITRDPLRARELGYRVRLWDFLFYLVFGAVVTCSTEIAGVLLVFSFLIVPAIVGTLFGATILTRLAAGWLSGLVASICGLGASYFLDLPPGAAIVCAFGVVLACALFVLLPSPGRE